VDGFLLTDIERDDPRIPILLAADLPVVIAGQPDKDCPFPWIDTAHGPGMASAAAHLASLGHERVGFLGEGPELEFVRVRERHWREALGGCAGPVATDPSSVLDERVTAVACTSDRLALELVAAAAARGVDVPGELSVTGFDDSPLAQVSSPPLTSVRIDYGDYGAAAAARLLALVDGEPFVPYEAPAPRLVVRGSTAEPG
jgi:DNA-binding LacI/PurR family transcriptional regulator